MSQQKVRYTSTRNYFPGPEFLRAGSIFTEDDWIKAGGRLVDLEAKVKSGSIFEAVQTPPPNLAPHVPPVPPNEQNEPTKPQGIWTFTQEELEPFDLVTLNVMYKSRADEFDVRVRPYKDKESLIKKMTSEL